MVVYNNLTLMRKKELALAERILESWLKGFNTNNWNEYIQLLSDNYVFKIPEKSKQSLNVPQSTIELFDYLKKRGIHEITTKPIKVSHTEKTFVFEFEEPLTETDDSYTYMGFALSFDYEEDVITNCREYFGNRK